MQWLQIFVVALQVVTPTNTTDDLILDGESSFVNLILYFLRW
jgi:hypothetical protein